MNTLKKKILFIITQAEFGGSQRFLFELVTRLDRDRYEILVAAGPAEYRNQELGIKNYELLDKLEQEKFKIRKLNYLKRSIQPLEDVRAFFEIKKLIASWKPDILFLNSSKAGFLGSLATRNSKLKVIYRIGGWSFNDPWPWWKKQLWIIAEKTTAHFKDYIILNNKRDYDQAVALRIKPRIALAVIHNGIELNALEFLAPEEARLKLFEIISKKYGKIFQADVLIGTIAHFYKTKGLEYLVDAAAAVATSNRQQATSFIVIGDGTERKNLERSIKEKNLEKTVFLTGNISDAYRYLKAFDIIVLPSVKEGFPWVALEAMAAKVPIIATSVGALPEIIENGKNGILVEPRNPIQIAEAIKEIVGSEKSKTELGIQAHQTVLFKFGIEKMMRRYEEILTD